MMHQGDCSRSVRHMRVCAHAPGPPPSPCRGAEYMEEMEEEEPEKFKAHFKNYLDNEIEADADAIEEMYTKARTIAPAGTFTIPHRSRCNARGTLRAVQLAATR